MTYINCDFNIDLEALLKAFHIHIDETSKELGEKMLIFMKSWNILVAKCALLSTDLEI